MDAGEHGDRRCEPAPGGDDRVLADDPGTIFAGVGYQGDPDGGLLVSTDDGRSWSLRSVMPQFSGGPNTGVDGLPAPHPRSTGTLLQIDGANGFLYAATFHDGVMRSSDGGLNWTTLGLAGEYLRSLAIDPADPHVLYAATYGDRVWKTTTASTDGTFHPLAAAPETVEDLAFIGSDLYAVGPTGLFRSSDGGATWPQVGADAITTTGTGPTSTTPTWFTVTGTTACGTTRLYVGGQFKGSSSLMVSADAGATWTSMLPPASVHTTEGGPGGPSWWLGANPLATLGGASYLATEIALDPTSADGACVPQRVLVSGRAGVFGTTDAGADWYPMMRGLAVTVVRGVAVDPNASNRVYIAPADWGFASSADGGRSVSRNAPPQVFDAFGVAVDPTTTPSTVYLATGQFSSNTGEIWSNPDPTSGAPWTSEGLKAAGGGRPTGLAVNRVNGLPVILAMTQSSGIWRKAGGTWSLVNANVQGGGQSSFSWIPGSATVYLFDDTTGVWRSNDAGKTWTEIWAQPSSPDTNGYVAADPRLPSRLYVSVGGIGLFRLDAADVGTVATGLIVPKPIGALSAPGPIAVRSDGATVATELPGPGDGPSVLVSTDLGATWTIVSDAGYTTTGGAARTLSIGSDASIWAGLFGDGLTTRTPPSYDLSVSLGGTGGGHVLSTPAGIDCPPACATSVGWGGAVTLTASSDATSTFTGWSGDCSGPGTCTVSMIQARSVTAMFTAQERPDAMISLGTAPFLGDGVYGTDGAGQMVSARRGPSRTASFRIRVQNDGVIADAFTLSGPADSAGFHVGYFAGAKNVTSGLSKGTYRTGMLAPGASITLTLNVSVLKGTHVGKVKDILVTAMSVSPHPLSDAVLARVTVG